MTWFVASLISVVELIGGDQEEYPVEETFYLFEAHSEAELNEKVTKEITSLNRTGSCHYYDKPARWHCLGARKIRSVYHSESAPDLDKSPPADGTELTHSFMVVKSLADVHRLVEGKTVMVRYMDNDSGEDFDEDFLSDSQI